MFFYNSFVFTISGFVKSLMFPSQTLHCCFFLKKTTWFLYNMFCFLILKLPILICCSYQKHCVSYNAAHVYPKQNPCLPSARSMSLPSSTNPRPSLFIPLSYPYPHTSLYPIMFMIILQITMLTKSHPLPKPNKTQNQSVLHRCCLARKTWLLDESWP